MHSVHLRPPPRHLRLILRHAVIGVLLAMFICIATHAAAGPILSVDPVVATVNPGDVFNLEVLIGATDISAGDDVSNLFAYQFSLKYDPQVLSANSISEGTFLSGIGTTFFVPGTIDNTLGQISFTANTLIGALAGVSGSGSLLTVKFTALALGASTVVPFFDIDSGDVLLDSSLSPIDGVATVAGIVNVGSVQPVPDEPSTFVLLTLGMALCAASSRLWRCRLTRNLSYS